MTPAARLGMTPAARLGMTPAPRLGMTGGGHAATKPTGKSQKPHPPCGKWGFSYQARVASLSSDLRCLLDVDNVLVASICIGHIDDFCKLYKVEFVATAPRRIWIHDDIYITIHQSI